MDLSASLEDIDFTTLATSVGLIGITQPYQIYDLPYGFIFKFKAQLGSEKISDVVLAVVCVTVLCAVHRLAHGCMIILLYKSIIGKTKGASEPNVRRVL